MADEGTNLFWTNDQIMPGWGGEVHKCRNLNIFRYHGGYKLENKVLTSP